MFRVLKCFVTPTVTYTAQVDESLLHICFDSHYVIEYMPSTCIECTASLFRVLKCFLTPTLTYTAQADESVLHICFESH